MTDVLSRITGRRLPAHLCETAGDVVDDVVDPPPGSPIERIVDQCGTGVNCICLVKWLTFKLDVINHWVPVHELVHTDAFQQWTQARPAWWTVQQQPTRSDSTDGDGTDGDGDNDDDGANADDDYEPGESAESGSKLTSVVAMSLCCILRDMLLAVSGFHVHVVSVAPGGPMRACASGACNCDATDHKAKVRAAADAWQAMDRGLLDGIAQLDRSVSQSHSLALSCEAVGVTVALLHAVVRCLTAPMLSDRPDLCKLESVGGMHRRIRRTRMALLLAIAGGLNLIIVAMEGGGGSADSDIEDAGASLAPLGRAGLVAVLAHTLPLSWSERDKTAAQTVDPDFKPTAGAVTAAIAAVSALLLIAARSRSLASAIAGLLDSSGAMDRTFCFAASALESGLTASVPAVHGSSMRCAITCGYAFLAARETTTEGGVASAADRDDGRPKLFRVCMASMPFGRLLLSVCCTPGLPTMACRGADVMILEALRCFLDNKPRPAPPGVVAFRHLAAVMVMGAHRPAALDPGACRVTEEVWRLLTEADQLRAFRSVAPFALRVLHRALADMKAAAQATAEERAGAKCHVCLSDHDRSAPACPQCAALDSVTTAVPSAVRLLRALVVGGESAEAAHWRGDPGSSLVSGVAEHPWTPESRAHARWAIASGALDTLQEMVRTCAVARPALGRHVAADALHIAVHVAARLQTVASAAHLQGVTASVRKAFAVAFRAHRRVGSDGSGAIAAQLWAVTERLAAVPDARHQPTNQEPNKTRLLLRQCALQLLPSAMRVTSQCLMTPHETTSAHPPSPHGCARACVQALSHLQRARLTSAPAQADPPVEHSSTLVDDLFAALRCSRRRVMDALDFAECVAQGDGAACDGLGPAWQACRSMEGVEDAYRAMLLAGSGGESDWDSALLGTTFQGRGRRLMWCCNRACTHLGGPAEAAAGGLRRLRKCGGCLVARYCSAECQRRAWRSGHRAACLGHGAV